MTCHSVVVSLSAVAATIAALSGCAASDGESAPPSPRTVSAPAAASAAPSPRTSPFKDGLEATVFLPPESAGPVPLIVLGAAGYWHTADVLLMEPLAEDLAARGAAVVLVPYRVAWEGGHLYPVPVEDMACGVAYAAHAVDGLEVSKVVVAGSSASAYMGALIALTPEAFDGDDCSFDPVVPDVFIGMAGPYDPNLWPAWVGCGFFGCEVADKKDWDGANPIALAGNRPEVPVLLIQGMLDEYADPAAAQEFADALRAGGHHVTLRLMEGAGAIDAQRPQVSGPIIGDWLGLAEPETASTTAPK